MNSPVLNKNMVEDLWIHWLSFNNLSVLERVIKRHNRAVNGRFMLEMDELNMMALRESLYLFRDALTSESFLEYVDDAKEMVDEEFANAHLLPMTIDGYKKSEFVADFDSLMRFKFSKKRSAEFKNSDLINFVVAAGIAERIYKYLASEIGCYPWPSE